MPTAKIASFWDDTLQQLAQVPLDATVEIMETTSDVTVTTYRVVMRSLGGIKIRAWYTIPSSLPPQSGWPAVMEMPSESGRFVFPGYLAQLGYATLTLYPRGQGESIHEWQLDQDVPKFLYNIADRDNYYHRGAYMDCIRGLDFLDSQAEIDSTRLGVWGTSQGGGLALTTASLDPRPKTIAARIPSLCNLPMAVELNAEGWKELHSHLQQHPKEWATVMDTLAYFDNFNLVDTITCPTLLSAAKIDSNHPYRTVVSVFEQIRAFKTLVVYPDATGGLTSECNVDFNQHLLEWFHRYL